jgi:hypothetical protein
MEYLDTKLCLAGKKVVGRRGAKVFVEETLWIMLSGLHYRLVNN